METDTPTTAQAIERGMADAGVSTSLPVAADYFAFDATERVTLPDNVSYIEYKRLNEGDRRKYLNTLNREARMQKATGDMIIRMQGGEEMHALLESAIVGWNLTRNGQPVPFSKGSPGSELSKFLNQADPRVVDIIDRAVRKANPWLLQELTLEEIDKEIERLHEMRDQKVKEEEGKAF